MSIKTVARFSLPIEAHIARSRLEAEGIPAFLADEHTVGLNWLWSNAMGGVRLQVPAEYAEDALRVLSEDFPAVENEEEPVPSESCPRCGGTVIQDVVQGGKPAFLTWLVLGFPAWRVKRVNRCVECGARFPL